MCKSEVARVKVRTIVNHQTPGTFLKDVMAPYAGYRVVGAYFGHEEWPSTDFTPHGWMSIWEDSGVRFTYSTSRANDYVILEVVFERSDELDILIGTEETVA